MGAIRRMMRRLAADDVGATAIEYGLLAALIVLGMVAGLGELGGGAGGMWDKLSNRFVLLVG